ncbi:MAG: HEAT repeat domain-containing protein [bacterium]|nr:HEAT repeat domain-containing protein [bacterium]
MAHGGVYRGPGSTIGPAPGGATTGGPTTGGAGAKNTDTANWEQWWSLNRDLHLALKDVIFSQTAATGDDDFYLGQGTKRGQWGPGLRPTQEVIHGKVVPALIEALDGQKDIDIITGVLLALAKIGDADEGRGNTNFEAVFRPFLAHSNQEVHETAAIALGVLGGQTAAPLLVDLIEDSSSARATVSRGRVPVRTRAFAAYGLGLIGHRARGEAVRKFVVHHLARAARVEGEPSRDLTVAALISIGLVPLENGNVPDIEGGETLRPSASRQTQILFLLNQLADETIDARARAYVPVALARLEQGAEPSFKDTIAARFVALIDKRSRADKILQQGVLHSLALLGDDDDDISDVAIREALTVQTSEGDRLARHVALLSLARVSARGGNGERTDAVETTRKLLLARLSKGGTAERPWAGLALGLLERGTLAGGDEPHEGTRRALMHALSGTKAPSESGAYSLALGLMNESRAIDELIPRTTNGDQNARGYAAVALGLLGARKAAPTLKSIVGSENYRPGLVREAAIGLALMGDKGAVPTLLARLENTKQMLEQLALASALGFIGDARSVDPLVALLQDKRTSETTRAFSAVALGVVCDKERFPWNSKLATDVGWWEAPATLLDPSAGKGILDLL